MYPITNEVKALFESEQRKVLRITGADKNGATITITDNNVIADSFQIDRYSCNGEKLEIGTAIAAQMSLTLENGSGQYNGIVFEGAELFVEVGTADWTQSSPTITYIPCGYFTPDEQPRRLSTINITALDRMTKFDVVVEATDLTFPTTIAGLVGQVCTLCGVTLAQSISGLVNAGVTVTELPTAQDEITYRNLIQWCAGIMGTNAWLDWNGQLRFSWYANSTGYVSTVDNRYSSDLYENDLTVSGVEYTNNSGIVIVDGTDDYAIDLTGNAIAGPLVATVLPPLNTALNGFTYRPFTAATVNAPYLWPMDIVTFTDKDGNDHTSALTNVAFGLNGTTALEAKGMTYAINKAAQPKGFTKEQAQLVNQAMDQVETNIDESLTQQEIFNRLTDNGAAQGLVLYNGQLYVNASYIRAGRINVGLIDFTSYDDYEFLIPSEYDSTTLFSGQSIVNGWITETNNTITVVKCNNAETLQGKKIVISVETKTIVSGGTTFWGGIEEFYSETWSAPAYGQEDAEGNLIGATGQGEFYRYETSWVVPNNTLWFSISFDTYGARAIRVSADTTSDFALMYGNNITMSYKGLQVGKFVVDKSGNVTSGARNQFDGAVYINGNIYFANPLSVSNGGTGANTAAGARSSLDVPSTTGSGASGTWSINVTGSSGSCTGHAQSDLALWGGTMTGRINFEGSQVGIGYRGTKATYDMIRFIDNTGDEYGNGIYIGGGGAAIIGGGESAAVAAAQVTGGNEILYLCNDGDVNVFSNMQNGWNDRKTFTFGANGTLTAPAFSGPLTGNVTGNCSGSSGSCASNNLTNIALTWSGSYSTGSWMLIYNGETGENGGALFRAINRANTAAWVDNEHKWARIGGDTFTGVVHSSGAGEKYFAATNTDTGCRVYLDSDSKGSGGNHGIYSNGYWNGSAFVSNGKWMIYRKQGGDIIVNGSCTGNAANVTGTVAVGNGGTGSTSAGGARNNLGIRSGRTSVSFSNGVGTIAFSTVGISSRPEVFIPMLNTTDSTGRYVVYAYQDSSSSINLRLYSGTSLVSGSTSRSISWICIA